MQRYSIGTYFQVYKSFKRGTLFGQMEEKWKFMKDWHRKKQKVLVRLTTKDGKEIAQAAIRVSSTEWKKQKAVLTATADAADAVLSVCPQMAGKYALDMVSLFPQNTFKGRKNPTTSSRPRKRWKVRELSN
jgi:uncharacterized membrane protein YkoI